MRSWKKDSWLSKGKLPRNLGVAVTKFYLRISLWSSKIKPEWNLDTMISRRVLNLFLVLASSNFFFNEKVRNDKFNEFRRLLSITTVVLKTDKNFKSIITFIVMYRLIIERVFYQDFIFLSKVSRYLSHNQSLMIHGCRRKPYCLYRQI